MSHPFALSCRIGILLLSLCAISSSLEVWAGEPPSEKLNCRVYDKKTSNIGLAFKVANFLFKAGPEISYDAQQGVNWDRTVQSFIVRYVELCERYNAGLVTKADYDQRLNQMEGIYREAQQIESKLFEGTRNRAKESLNELDEMMGRKQPPSEGPAQAGAMDDAINRLAGKIEGMEPIGTALKPVKPCAPPDMLGAPGVLADPGVRC
jgi:hypothetical protein